MMKPDTPKFVLVPVEPTVEMFMAGYRARKAHLKNKHIDDGIPLTDKIWSAMISAAPKPDCVGVEEMRFMCITAYRDYLNNGNEPKVCAAVFLIDYLVDRGLLAVKGSQPVEEIEGLADALEYFSFIHDAADPPRKEPYYIRQEERHRLTAVLQAARKYQLLAVKEKAQENTPERINNVYTAERMDGPCYFVDEETNGGRS